MSTQVFKFKNYSVCLSALLILLLCLFFMVIPARGLSHRFVSAVEHEPEVHVAEHEEEVHEEAEHEEEHVVVGHEEEAHEEAGHEVTGHGDAEHEAEEGIKIPAAVDAAFFIAIAVLILGAGKILGVFAKKTA